jgi:phosphopantothenoylcysteine decarboxylase/phosphopantothenate--cysteine ligase
VTPSIAPQLRVVVGITGGIAAYKAVAVVRAFVLAGYDVQVVATDAALRFVGKPTLEAISRNPVHTDLYEGVAEVRHVSIGQNADLIVVAPATAHTIAKIAAGLADDLLGNTILASNAPVVIAPAMHSEMWSNPATVANVAVLRQRGMTIVGPASGQLTGSDSGVGRMSEPADIVGAALGSLRTHDLAGKTIIVTAGGTREAIDPVRYIGNRSSGKQGVAIAKDAAARGASVLLIGAHLEVDVPPGIMIEHVSTARELQQALTLATPSADVVIMAAAVSDYRPERVMNSKIKKDAHGEHLSLSLVQNPDILRTLVDARLPGQRFIGFAAETETDRNALLSLGRAKLARKGCDFLVLNSVGWSEGFGTELNTVIVLDASGAIVGEATGTKTSVAASILDVLS